MKTNLSLLLTAAALACGSSAAFAAQDGAIVAALDEARSAIAASPAKPTTHCPDAKELEVPFELTIAFTDGRKPFEMSFEYEGCRAEGRNDMMPPYTERSYKGTGGYALDIVTDQGKPQSDVLLWSGKDWAGQLGKIANAPLVSGNPMNVDFVGMAGERKGSAVLRASSRPPYPQLMACETADWTNVASSRPQRDGSGMPTMGYGRSSAPSLVLLTNAAAYYYHEDCDICAEVTKCELATGRLSSAISAHRIDCGDMKPYSKDAVYDACADGR